MATQGHSFGINRRTSTKMRLTQYNQQSAELRRTLLLGVGSQGITLQQTWQTPNQWDELEKQAGKASGKIQSQQAAWSAKPQCWGVSLHTGHWPGGSETQLHGEACFQNLLYPLDSRLFTSTQNSKNLCEEISITLLGDLTSSLKNIWWSQFRRDHGKLKGCPLNSGDQNTTTKALKVSCQWNNNPQV